MKKFNFLSVLLIMFTALSITSCDTEPVDPVLNDNINPENPQNPENPNNPNPGAGVFKVDFSGSTYIAASTVAVVGEGLITIGGLRGESGEAVSVVVQGNAVGTYGSDQVILDYTPGNSEYSYSNFNTGTGDESGTVTISEIDTVNKTISGTFSFTGWWSGTNNLAPIEFTNGSFEDIPYTDNFETGDQYFKAIVDGEVNEYAGDDLIVVAAGETSVNMIAYGANHEFNISLSNQINPGTYNITANSPDGIAVTYTDENDVEYTVTSGTLTIISNEGGWLEGAFTFAVKNDAGETIHTVTDGEFNVEYDF